MYFVFYYEPPKVGNNSNETHANVPFTNDAITVENLGIPTWDLQQIQAGLQLSSKNTTFNIS